MLRFHAEAMTLDLVPQRFQSILVYMLLNSDAYLSGGWLGVNALT